MASLRPKSPTWGRKSPILGENRPSPGLSEPLRGFPAPLRLLPAFQSLLASSGGLRLARGSCLYPLSALGSLLIGAIRPTKGVPRGAHAIQGAPRWDSIPGPAARKSCDLTTTPESLAQQGRSDNDRVRGCRVTGDNARRNFAHRDLSDFSTKSAETRGARSSCNPLSDVLGFVGGDSVFVCVFLSARRGAVRDRVR